MGPAREGQRKDHYLPVTSPSNATGNALSMTEYDFLRERSLKGLDNPAGINRDRLKISRSATHEVALLIVRCLIKAAS